MLRVQAKAQDPACPSSLAAASEPWLDGLGVVAQPLLLVVGLWQPFSHEMMDGD